MTSRTLSPAPSRLRRPLLAVTLIAAMTATVLAQSADPVASLPASPKDLLAALTTDTATIGQIAETTQSSADWTSQLSGMGTTMAPEQLALLAEYLALNLPAPVSGSDAASMIASLPADGRELFAQTCFACHGVVPYYLQQDRDVDGWMEIFSAPYHRRLLTEDKARETFASYAASAMPIAAEDIPADWQK